jgi:hypothetical protein
LDRKSAAYQIAKVYQYYYKEQIVFVTMIQQYGNGGDGNRDDDDNDIYDDVDNDGKGCANAESLEAVAPLVRRSFHTVRTSAGIRMKDYQNCSHYSVKFFKGKSMEK